MKRIISVLAVMAIMAALLAVMAAPAFAPPAIVTKDACKNEPGYAALDFPNLGQCIKFANHLTLDS